MSLGANSIPTSFPADQTGDVSRQRSYAAVRACGLDPAILANTDETLGITKLASKHAVGPGGTFRAHTKEATILSYAILATARGDKPTEQFAKVAEALTKRARFFRCESVIDAIDRHLQSGEEPWTDADFAFVVKSGAETVRQLPIKTPELIAQADAWVQAHRRDLNSDDARRIAEKIAAAAAKHKVEISEGLQKLAGQGEFLRGDALTQVSRREWATKVKMPEVSECCRGFREKLAAEPINETTAKTTFEFLSTVDRLMSQRGLSTKYMPLPEDAAYGGTARELHKLAHAFLQLGNGSLYRTEDVAEKLDLAAVQDRFGTKMANELTNGISFDETAAVGIFEELDGRDATAMESILKQCGVQPFHKQASRPFSPGNIHRLASTALAQ